jgi:hypothetical protein
VSGGFLIADKMIGEFAVQAAKLGVQHAPPILYHY